MRYRSPHAAEGGRAPLVPRGSKSVRAVLTAVVAGAIGLVPSLVGFTPAHANTPGTYLTITDASVTEGGNLVFNYRYTGTGDTFSYSEAPVGAGGAVAGTDYTAPTGPLVLGEGSITAVTGTISVSTTLIPNYEPSRAFTLTATGVGDTAAAVGTINDSSTAPSYTLSATPNPVNEAVTSVSITATLSAVSGVNTVVTVTAADGTAKAGTNYNGTITPITITAGQLTGTTSVAIMDDGKHDPISPMTFTVNGSATNVSNRYQSAQIGINDAQPMPKLTLTGPATVAEGSTATYTVTADYQSATPITVNWSAVDTTPATGHAAATPGDDFPYPASGRTATIAAGATTTTIAIPITQDNLNELSEDYAIALSDPANATLGTTTKVVTTITSADLAPTVSVAPTSVTEGDSGTRMQTFTATLSAPSGRAVTVDWNTADGTALQGYDYVATSGTLVFPAGTTTKTFSVGIIGDKTYEPGNETFSIQLAAPGTESPASLSVSAPATITILDDDTQPTVSVDDITVKEGDITTAVLVPVKLSNPSSQSVTYTLTDTPLGTTSNDPTSIVPGANDYNLLNSGVTVTIPQGQLTGYGVVLINGDTMYEPDELANIAWTASNVAAPSSGTAKLTILNDDKAPNFEVNSIKGHEGDTVDVTGTVSGWSQTVTHLTVTFTGTSVNGQKGADPDDFVNPGGSAVDIAAGTAPGVVLPVASLKLNTDDKDEPDETILASGVGTNNVGTVTDGVITIIGHRSTPPPMTPTLVVPRSITGVGTVVITGKADPGATVNLYGAPWQPADVKLSKMTSTTAGSDGSFRFAPKIYVGYRFAVAVGDQWSDDAKVSVTQVPLFLASSPAKGKLSLAVQGNPRGSKQAVTIQVYKSGKWVNTWHGTTGSDNLWKATVAEKSKSGWTLRAYVAGDAANGINGGYSATKKVTIK